MARPVRAVTGVLTGKPVFSNMIPVQELDTRSNHILRLLQTSGAASLDQLQEATGLAHTELIAELSDLEQQGLVLVVTREDEAVYKATF